MGRTAKQQGMIIHEGSRKAVVLWQSAHEETTASTETQAIKQSVDTHQVYLLTEAIFHWS